MASVVTGIVICKDKALVFMDKDDIFLPKFPMDEGESTIDSFCRGIRRSTGITRNQLMFVKDMECSATSEMAGKEHKTYCLLWKTFLFELPQSYKGKRMDWTDIRNLWRVLTYTHERNFCKSRTSEIYNAKYDMKRTSFIYPRDGVRY